MKKFMLFAASALALGLVSCSEKKANSNESAPATLDIVFEPFSYEQIAEYANTDSLNTDGSNYVKFIGQGVLPQDIGDDNIKHLRDTLVKIANIAFNNDGTPIAAVPDDMKVTDLSTSDTEACGEVINALSTTLVTPRVVVWENTTESYACGAAHGNHSTAYVNFDMTNGKIITISDLFKEGYKDSLTKLVRNKLKTSDYNLLIPISQVPLSDEFAITSKGILFSYDPYEIAPYSDGTVQVELSIGEITDLLSDGGNYILTGVKPS